MRTGPIIGRLSRSGSRQPRMALNSTSRLRLAAVVATGASVLVGSALVALKTRGFACGWSHSTSFRKEAAEGEAGSAYWVGSVPGRLMLASEKFDSAYPNDLPLGTPRETSEQSGWFCRDETQAQGMADWADPTTYPTTLGFAWMNRTVPLSSHWRQHYRVLIVPHGFVLTVAMAPAALLTLQLIRRRQGFSRGCCAKCGYDLRATPERCPECGTVAE